MVIEFHPAQMQRNTSCVEAFVNVKKKGRNRQRSFRMITAMLSAAIPSWGARPAVAASFHSIIVHPAASP
jgi:hypothetical protein